MTLRELLRFVCAIAEQRGHGLPHDLASEIEMHVIRRYQGERLYIRLPDESAKQKILAIDRHMHTSAISERLGVSRQWVNRVRRRSI